MEKNRMILICAFLAVIAGVTQHFYFSDKILPMKLPPIEGIPVDKKAWGTYRAHMYFGMRLKDRRSPLFGMLWNHQPDVVARPNIRHWCEHDDGITSYGWDAADGRTFGVQNITDKTTSIKIEWINHKDTWTARVKSTPIKGFRHTFMFYLASQQREDPSTKFHLGDDLSEIFHVTGARYGGSKLSISFPQKNILQTNLVWDGEFSPVNIKDLILQNTGAIESDDGKLIYQLNPQHNFKQGKFIAVQFNVPGDVTFEISYSTRNTQALSATAFTKELQKRVNNFNRKFEDTFHLESKGYTTMQLKMAKVALSNMLGSIGYWHGENRVALGKEVKKYGPHLLISAVPSRSFFPRGFLWDEGFHNMLISTFDPELTLEILTTWLNVMNEEGWIPREMILGEESEAKVPPEFIIQRTDVANPPSIFLVFNELVSNSAVVQKHGKLLAAMYPKLERWFNWLLTSQRGKKKGTFRWRGRNDTTELELNPKTLASGLDDIPRASHPSTDEYHLDLRCWMAICSKVMAKLSSLYASATEAKKYKVLSEELNDYSSLLNLHWSQSTKEFCDYGNHSRKVRLAKVISKKQPGTYTIKRHVEEEPRLRLVEDVFGYNSLFPLMMKLIPADSRELTFVLSKLRNTKELWTDFGLRSLSASSPYYSARNTEHDPPYWRGNIWINMNYMVISALKHYSKIEGPSQETSKKLYSELRENIFKNMAKEFTLNGYFWEHYNDRTGKGGGTHPFTGWSSLVLLIMGDASDTIL
ncbi:unnamed protein product [Auanema sp. JU1783]|nr:unnamed protein product [Auanema sp. JU1783]